MSFLAELQRRSVYKVAALYIIVSWVVLQVVDLFMSFMPLPDWTSRLVFVLLAAGFPVALLLAWAIELTPDGMKLEKSAASSTSSPSRADWLIYAGLGFVVIAGLYSVDWRGETDNRENTAIRSLAVLPLNNLMNDSEQAYFVEGMHEALITELSKIDALHVISRTSAMKYLDSEKSVPEIGQELGVDAVIEGSVLRAGDTVRITTQLIDASSDSHLWAQQFDRELKDILALYADVTREIADQIRIEVTPEDEVRLSDKDAINADAYVLYLKGKFHCDQWGPQEMMRGIEFMRQATKMDPENALAQSGLSVCLQYAAFFGYLASLDIFEEANRAAKTAIELDRNLADGWASLAGVRYYLGFDLVAAEMAVERALSINPSHLQALIHYSWQLGEAGRFEQAMELGERASQLDPLSPVVRSTVAQAYYLNGDFENAVREWRAVSDLAPDDPSYHYYLAWSLEQLGKLDEAIELHQKAIELSARAPLYVGGLGYAYGRAGRTAEAIQLLDELTAGASEDGANAFNIAVVNLGLGRHKEALDWLEKSFAARDSHMMYIKQAAQFDPLRSKPRFERLLRAMGW